ncbi:MAG: RDD family protein, partial [Acidimicrobiales bacterium]
LQVGGLALSPLSQETAAAVAALVYLAYELSFVAWRGQTPAKMAVGTRVVDADHGGRPTLWQAATRAVVPLAGVVADVALGAPGVGALWVLIVYGLILWDDRRRGLHDRAAGTVVVVVERSEAHRRVGVAAVVVAVAVTAVSVALALDASEEDLPAASAPARR